MQKTTTSAVTHQLVSVGIHHGGCSSTNSLLGAPAFVITTGLIWIQYEFALPLAMVFIMIFLIPFYRKLNLVSVYAYQERRFGRSARTMLSVTFQLLRAFATGVTVYGISIVLQSIIGIPFALSVLIRSVTVVYDMLGGMAAVDLRRDSDGDPVPGNRPLCGLQRLGCWRRFRGLHQLRIPRQHRRYRIICGPAGRRLQRHRSHRRYAVRILVDAARRPVSLRVLLREPTRHRCSESSPQRTSTTPTAR